MSVSGFSSKKVSSRNWLVEWLSTASFNLVANKASRSGTARVGGGLAIRITLTLEFWDSDFSNINKKALFPMPRPASAQTPEPRSKMSSAS